MILQCVMKKIQERLFHFQGLPPYYIFEIEYSANQALLMQHLGRP